VICKESIYMGSQTRTRPWWLQHVMIALSLSVPAISAAAQANYCSLLSTQEVAAVLGAPVVLSGDGSAKALPGTQVRSQDCKYETKETHKKYMDMTVEETPSPALAATLFKSESQIFGSNLGPQPISGLGDEALLYPASGSLYMRKKNLCLHFRLSGYALSTETRVAVVKKLAARAISQIH
jgi:hypothetical protein